VSERPYSATIPKMTLSTIPPSTPKISDAIANPVTPGGGGI
jgi:hypothetical protein